MENPTLAEVFNEWNDRRLELKKISNATHLRNRQSFNRHYKEFGKKRIKSVNADIIGEFLEAQVPYHNLTAKAFSNLKSITRVFLKRAKRRIGKYVHVVKEFPKSQAGVRTAIIPKDYEWMAKAVKLQNPFSEYIFVKDGERISTQAMRMRLKRICKKLNIFHKSPHKIRKTYGSI